jgi:dihydroorotate dehydrogenase
MSIAQMIESDFDGAKDVSAIGGVETGRDAAEFILLGANSVQVHSCLQLCCIRHADCQPACKHIILA